MPEPDPDKIDPIELEPTAGDFVPEKDERARIPEPLPVRIVSVEDILLPALAGAETEMDDFYVTMLQFVKDYADPTTLVYRADNFRIILRVLGAPIQREGYRPLIIEVQSLPEAELKLITREMEFEHQRGLTPGDESLVLLDPSGNSVQIIESRRVM